jgi:5-methylcytosine-specific restriction endonuclease McrA
MSPFSPATPVVDRAGNRIRLYQRKRTDRPGSQERRAMRALGLAWCSGECQAWLLANLVTKQGQCRPCVNARYREAYAANGVAIRRRVHARRRNVEPLPLIGSDHLTEQFEGRCAYCPAPADTWDHVIAVAAGGETVPGNVVPACRSCNSSKNDSDVWSWLARTGRTPSCALLDVIYLVEVA